MTPLVRFPINRGTVRGLAISASLLCGTWLHGQEKPLGLRDAVLLSLSKNAAVRVESLEVERRGAVAEQASGQFDTYLVGSIEAEQQRAPIVVNGSDTLAKSTTQTLELAAVRQLRNGITLQPTLGVETDDSTAPTREVSGVGVARLQVIVPLLRGLGADSAAAAESAALGDVETARLLYRHTLAVQTLATATSYWNAFAAAQTLEVQRDVEQRAQSLREALTVLVESRVFPPNYLTQTEANYQEKFNTRARAEIDAISGQVAFGQALGLSPAEMPFIPAVANSFPKADQVAEHGLDQPVSQQALINRALNRRADYRALQQANIPLEILVRQATADQKPRVDLVLAAGYNGFSEGSNLLPPITRRATGGNGSVALELEWPMANRARTGLLRERRVNLQQNEAAIEQLASAIAAEVMTATATVRLEAEALQSAERTVELATRAVAGQREQLRNGESTVLDVINLENLASSARLNLIRTQASLAVAIVRLRYATGDLFEPTDDEASFTLNPLDSLPPHGL